MKKRMIVGATGASGLPILVQCLKLLREQDEFQSYLIMTDNAKLTFEHETGQPVRKVEALADEVLDASEIGAGTRKRLFSDRRHADRSVQYENGSGNLQRIYGQPAFARGRCDDKRAENTCPCSKGDSA